MEIKYIHEVQQICESHKVLNLPKDEYDFLAGSMIMFYAEQFNQEIEERVVNGEDLNIIVSDLKEKHIKAIKEELEYE